MTRTAIARQNRNMNPDQKLIESAYEDAIKGLYARLFDGYAQGAGAAGEEQQAEKGEERADGDFHATSNFLESD